MEAIKKTYLHRFNKIIILFSNKCSQKIQKI